MQNRTAFWSAFIVCTIMIALAVWILLQEQRETASNGTQAPANGIIHAPAEAQKLKPNEI